MAATECGHGHIYDSDIYASCPYCNSTQPVINFGAGDRTAPIGGGYAPQGGGYQPGTSAMDPGRTAPIGGGYGPQGGGYPQPGAPVTDMGKTAPIGGGYGGGVPAGDSGATQPPRGYRAREKRADEEQHTVGDMQQSMGLEPVVGWLVCIEGKEKGKDYRLLGRINTIGRGEKMDVCIKGDPTISKENHARLGYDPKNNRFRLIPAASANNIYLNEEVVDVPTPLKAYDVMEFGQTKLVFIPLCSTRFSWADGVRGPEEKGDGTV